MKRTESGITRSRRSPQPHRWRSPERDVRSRPGAEPRNIERLVNRPYPPLRRPPHYTAYAAN